MITSLRELLTCSDPLKAWALVDALSLEGTWSARELLYAVERVLHQNYCSVGEREPPCDLQRGILKARRQLLHRQHGALRHHDLALNKGLFLKLSWLQAYFLRSRSLWQASNNSEDAPYYAHQYCRSSI